VDNGCQTVLKTVGCKSFVGSNPISSTELSHGVIGSTTVFGTVSLGSSPSEITIVIIMDKNKGRLTAKDLLVENCKHSRANLKRLIYREKLLPIKCNECGQNEIWRGRTFSLVLDHINGINNDNRIENLRLMCPNCNATLDTHCRKKK
jgi:predicted RNA-binding Zn-ribbon protein involved in translation (DUF1610 family)